MVRGPNPPPQRRTRHRQVLAIPVTRRVLLQPPRAKHTGPNVERHAVRRTIANQTTPSAASSAVNPSCNNTS